MKNCFYMISQVLLIYNIVELTKEGKTLLCMDDDSFNVQHKYDDVINRLQYYNVKINKF